MLRNRMHGRWELNGSQKLALGLLVLVGVGLIIILSARPSSPFPEPSNPPSQAQATTPTPAPIPAPQDKPADNQAVNRKEVVAEARAILRDIKAMESEGRNIPQRTGAGHEDCMNKINGRWQRVQALRERVKSLPKGLQIYLGAAASELINCYSCDSDSLSLCAQARDWIKEAEKDIAE